MGIAGSSRCFSPLIKEPRTSRYLVKTLTQVGSDQRTLSTLDVQVVKIRRATGPNRTMRSEQAALDMDEANALGVTGIQTRKLGLIKEP